MGADKRKFRRISTNWIARIRTRAATESTRVRLEEKIKNVSMGGVFIETRMPFPQGSVVEFEFQLPGRKDVYMAEGLVKWSNDGRYVGQPLGMGIEFLSISSKLVEAISDAIGKPTAQDVLVALTETAEQQALLAFYAQKEGQTFEIEVLEKFLGVPKEKLVKMVSDLSLYGLAQMAGEKVTLAACPEPDLKLAIGSWAASRKEPDGGAAPAS